LIKGQVAAARSRLFSVRCRACGSPAPFVPHHARPSGRALSSL